MMANRLLATAIVCLLGAGLTACETVQPELNEQEKAQLDESAHPFDSRTLYDTALEQMGKEINSSISFHRTVQSKPIGNAAGGQELPFNMTNMMINSLSKFAGSKFAVVPYDPEFIINDFNTGGSGSRMLPNLVIAGSITEFDKDIEADVTSIDLDLLVGGGSTETDIGFGADRSMKLSRVVIDIHLLDYDTHSVIPGAAVSNTIHVLEIEKDRDFGFAVYGSGMGISGRIRHAQGFHRAVRTLVEYSVLQLFGRYYALPYWQWAGMEYADPAVLRSMKKSFGSKPRRQQIQDIQVAMKRLELGPVQDPVSGEVYNQPPADGILDPVTDAFISKYLGTFEEDIAVGDLSSLYVSLLSHGERDQLTATRPEDGAVISIEEKFHDRYSGVIRVYPQL